MSVIRRIGDLESCEWKAHPSTRIKESIALLNPGAFKEERACLSERDGRTKAGRTDGWTDGYITPTIETKGLGEEEEDIVPRIVHKGLRA